MRFAYIMLIDIHNSLMRVCVCVHIYMYIIVVVVQLLSCV